jgi:N-acetylglucosaminyldiphosphoundecaprenol N-acetyl-beta-D-mannosaminyltransferase
MVQMINTIDLLGLKIVRRDLSFIELDRKYLINTISPNSFGISIKDLEMRKALKGTDFLTLDGLYFGLAPLLLKGKLPKRIAGWDSFIYFSTKMNARNGRVFFLGSTPETLKKIISRYRTEYPNVITDCYSPPYKPEFDEEDLKKMHEAINKFKPNVLFVGLTAPKQEKWGFMNKPFINTNIICTIGNVFDWYAGNSIRPAKFWRIIGLEWFIRIFYRPEILKRNLSNQLLFFWYLLLIILKIKKYD